MEDKNELTVDQGKSQNGLAANSACSDEEFMEHVDLQDEWQDDDLMMMKTEAKFDITTKPTNLDFERPKRKISVQLDAETTEGFESDALSDLDCLPTPEELSTPSDMGLSPRRVVGIDLEWDNDTPIYESGTTLDKPKPSGNDATQSYRMVVIGDQQHKMDLQAIIPYKQVLTHGGYYGEGLNAIVLFSACFLPDVNQTDYDYIMDNLFLYVVSTLDLLVADDYMIVFFNGGCKRRNIPRLTWMKRCYQMIHRRLRKNLKQLLIVHPQWYMRFLITFFRPFISSKFSRKLKLISSLKELSNIITLDGINIPDAVQSHDAKRYSSSRRVKVKKSEDVAVDGDVQEVVSSDENGDKLST